MPLVEIKAFEGRLSQNQPQEFIRNVTDVMVSFAGENLHQAAWVVVPGVKGGDRGRRQSVGS